MNKKAKACYEKFASKFVAPEHEDRNYFDFSKFFLNNTDFVSDDDYIEILLRKYKEHGKVEKLAKLFENHSDLIYVAVYFAEAQFCLPNPDYAKVFQYFQHAKTLGSLVAMQRLAQMYKLGLGVPKDIDKCYALHQEVFALIKKGSVIPQVLIETQWELAQIELQRGNVEQAQYHLEVALLWYHDCSLHKVGGYGDGLLKVLNLRYKLDKSEFALCPADGIVFALQKPCTVTIFGKTVHKIKSFYDKGKLVVQYNDQYFNGVTKFVRLCKFGEKTFYQKFKYVLYEVEYDEN